MFLTYGFSLSGEFSFNLNLIINNSYLFNNFMTTLFIALMCLPYTGLEIYIKIISIIFYIWINIYNYIRLFVIKYLNYIIIFIFVYFMSLNLILYFVLDIMLIYDIIMFFILICLISYLKKIAETLVKWELIQKISFFLSLFLMFSLPAFFFGLVIYLCEPDLLKIYLYMLIYIRSFFMIVLPIFLISYFMHMPWNKDNFIRLGVTIFSLLMLGVLINGSINLYSKNNNYSLIKGLDIKDDLKVLHERDWVKINKEIRGSIAKDIHQDSIKNTDKHPKIKCLFDLISPLIEIFQKDLPYSKPIYLKGKFRFFNNLIQLDFNRSPINRQSLDLKLYDTNPIFSKNNFTLRHMKGINSNIYKYQEFKISAKELKYLCSERLLMKKLKYWYFERSPLPMVKYFSLEEFFINKIYPDMNDIFFLKFLLFKDGGNIKLDYSTIVINYIPLKDPYIDSFIYLPNPRGIYRSDDDFMDINILAPSSPMKVYFPEQGLLSERLILRFLNISDFDDFFSLQNEIGPNISHSLDPNYQPPSMVKSRKSFEGYYISEQTSVLSIFKNNPEQTFIGRMALHPYPRNIPSIGYILKEEHWGIGYGTEAVRTFLKFYWTIPFKEQTVSIRIIPSYYNNYQYILQANKLIQACTHIENYQSRHLLKKVGFKFNGKSLSKTSTSTWVPEDNWLLSESDFKDI